MPPILRVVWAEAARRWSLHPVSTVMSAVVFPALMVAVLFYLPTANLLGQRLDLLTAAVSVEGSALGDATRAPPPWAAPVLEALEDQPLYRIVWIPGPEGAQGAFDRGEAAVAITLSAPSTPGAPVGVAFTRRYDLLSDLLLDRLERQVFAEMAPLLAPLESEDHQETDDARGHVARVGLFVLLGFAWFFTSSGVIERFVAEKERRTLETLLSTAVSPALLLRGRLLEISLHGALPQVACGLALLALGFSIYALCLPVLVCFTLYPFSLFCFWILRNTEDMVSAGWRTGVSFMFGFPLVILLSDVLGTLSPFYQVARALVGEPTWSIYLPGLLGLVALTALSWALSGPASRAWRL